VGCRTGGSLAEVVGVEKSQTHEILSQADLKAHQAQVTTSCLVMQCARDVIAPQAVGKYVHGQLRDSELVLVDATGHYSNLSAPAETIRAIVGTMRRIPVDVATPTPFWRLRCGIGDGSERAVRRRSSSGLCS
jgi:hypothetical protein